MIGKGMLLIWAEKLDDPVSLAGFLKSAFNRVTQLT